MNSFKEKVNQFFKKNYEIENFITNEKSNKESILKIYDFIYSKKDILIESDFLDFIDLMVNDIVSSDSKKVIEAIIFCSFFEEEGWPDCSANPEYSDMEDISNPVSKRREELSELFDTDEEKYEKLFGQQGDDLNDKKELKYCLQDVFKDKILTSMCFDYVVRSCVESMIIGYSYRDVKDEFKDFLDIVL